MVQTVRLTIEDSPVAREQGDRCPYYAVRAGSTGRSHPGRDAEADPHGLVDHGDSAVAGGHGDRRPVVQLGRVSTGAVVEKAVVLPQLHLWRNSLRAAHELRWRCFRGPVHRYRAGGRVHRDTAPIIRCTCA